MKTPVNRVGTHRTLFVVLSLALLPPVWAATETTESRPMRFEHITLDDGLSQSNVFAILQDSNHLMWFATENGLNSYNGYEFTHYRQERGNPDALGSDYVYDLAEDADGNLWVATSGGGLARLAAGNRSIFSFRHDPENSNSLSNNVVRTLLVNPDGTLWLGTRGGGLDHFDPSTGKFTHHSFETAATADGKANEIYSLYRSKDGTLWIGSNRGLAMLNADTGQVLRYRHDATLAGSLSDDRVRAIYEDSAGSLWVGTYGGGLNRLDRESGIFTRFQHDPENAFSLGSNRVTSIFEDNAGRLWIGTSGGLHLADRENNRFTRYVNDGGDAASLGDNEVTALYQDRGGVLWVGTRYRGLSKWNPETWAYGLETAEKLTASAERKPNVTSFVEDERSRLWVGTFGDGVNVLRGSDDEVIRYRHDPENPNSISDDRVMSLLRDSYGYIWIGTMTGGLNRLHPATGKIEVFQQDPANGRSIAANGIMSLMEDSAGRIWAGTFGGGLSRFDRRRGEFTNYPARQDTPGALTSGRVTALAEDPSGLIWVGTDAGGLNLFNPKSGEFTAYRHDPADPQSLAADTVYAINIDREGQVWIGTRGGGLDRVLGDARTPGEIRFENFSQADGLANDVVYGVQFDSNGHVWMSTNYGISRLDPESRMVRNLHRKDGLQSEEFNFGAHYRSAGGELFFGGHNGFNAFRPEALPVKTDAPPVMLTGVFNGNDRIKAPVDEDEGVDLGYQDDSVSFEFAALDYAAPESNSYRYMLEGFDRNWIELGQRRRVTYTDLDAGNYTLRVQAANAAGVWNEQGLSLPVRVKPAPWESAWAITGYVLIAMTLAFSLWAAYRLRIRREEEYSRRLEFEVRERTQKLLDRNKQLNEMNRSLQRSSLSDPLTGLRNRRFVFEEVSRDLEVARRKQGNEQNGVDARGIADLVFMMIDLDNFKPINDTFGHAAGDQILLQVRDVLLHASRSSDFVVRWGGDEFVVIAKQAMPGESESLAERIRSRVARHNFLLEDGQLVRTTCSIGFVQYPLFRASQDTADLDQILSIADSLMYEAKKRRNAWAGLLSPSEAATSFDYDQESIDPTSLLFRARRAGSVENDVESTDATADSPRLAVVR